MSSKKEVTQYMRELAAEAIATENEGTMTRSEALARLIWDTGLGYTIPDPDNPGKTIVVRGKEWAMKLLLDRMEGRVTDRTSSANTGPKISDKVSELGVNRINAITDECLGGGADDA